MKFLPLILIIVSLYFISCKNPKEKTKTVFVTDTTKVTDTIIFIRDSMAAAAFPDSLPAGIYHGMFPCDNCEGIQQIIAFDSGRTFRQELQKWGIENRPLRRTGNWDRKEGQIWLYSNGKVIAKLLYADKKLRMTEENGNRINNKDSLHYTLTKSNAATSNTAWKKKKEEGIDFMALGNEPFWSLQIDNEKFIMFKTSAWKKAVVVPIELPKQYADSTVYTVTAERLPLRIGIYPEFGSDGMSDFMYEYRVEVRYMGKVYFGRGIYMSRQ